MKDQHGRRATVAHADGRRSAIRERDPLTRFSYAWGPLTRYPGCSIEEVRRVVQVDCAELSDELLTLLGSRQEKRQIIEAAP